MLEMKNGFVVTDVDCMQCRKDLGNRGFLFIQSIWLGEGDAYAVVANIEDLKPLYPNTMTEFWEWRRRTIFRWGS